jgi:hypothetical protein
MWANLPASAACLMSLTAPFSFASTRHLRFKSSFCIFCGINTQNALLQNKKARDLSVAGETQFIRIGGDK